MLEQEIEALYKQIRLMHYRSMFRAVREKEGSLSAAEAFAVDVISLLGTPTISAFAESIGISQPNATYKINNLISKGYVERLPAEGDRREVRIRVCNKYYKYRADGNDYILSAAKKLEERIGQDESEKLGSEISLLRSLLNEDIEK